MLLLGRRRESLHRGSYTRFLRGYHIQDQKGGWEDLIRKRDFDPADTALRYGYADQPHMLREFRKHMGRSMGKAREDALKDVGILQYSRIR